LFLRLFVNPQNPGSHPIQYNGIPSLLSGILFFLTA
jgi:hypothetical protein